MREFELIDQLRAQFQPRRADVRLGIGDDAAILAPPAGQDLLVTSDTLIAGRHFHDDAPPADIGYKAIAVNLSDLAAMGATPAWLTLSLAAPELSSDWCRDFVSGIQAACTACPVDAPIDIVGGDTTQSARTTITVTAMGHAPAGQAVRRSGARPGDLIAVTGTLGDAAAGLALWPRRDTATPNQRILLDRLTRPDLRRGTALVGQANSAIDVSDGLLADLGHILKSSKCGARLWLDHLPTSSALLHEIPDAAPRRRLQISGGDDYELCFSFPPERQAAVFDALGCPVQVIGEIVADPGLIGVTADGPAIDLHETGSQGWDHFA